MTTHIIIEIRICGKSVLFVMILGLLYLVIIINLNENESLFITVLT